MADFVSPFWHWFVTVPSVLGLVACLWLIFANQEKEKGEAKVTGHKWDGDLEELDNPLPKWWFNMFLITIIFGAIYLALYPGLGTFKGLLGWTQTGQYDTEVSTANAKYDPLFEKFAGTEIPQLVSNDEAQKAGERLFANYCTVCHGSDARGAPGFPNLRDDDWLWGGTPDAIKVSIQAGRRGAMPGWAPMLGEDGVENVVTYVESLAGRDVDAAAAEKGKEKYNQLCVGCHMPTGVGMQALGAPNLTDGTWLYGGTRHSIRESVANGRNGNMPPHGEFLGEAKVHVLAAYVYGLSNK